MPTTTRILVTGATGKVGHAFIARVLADPKFDSAVVRALCHNRELAAHERIEIVIPFPSPKRKGIRPTPVVSRLMAFT